MISSESEMSLTDISLEVCKCCKKIFVESDYKLQNKSKLLELWINIASQELQFPIQIKSMTKEETKQYHLKKLNDLSLKSIGEIPQLEEPTYEQKVWLLHRLKQSEESWRSCSE
jgi:hypothetical protein